MSAHTRLAVLFVLLLPAAADACWFDWLFRSPRSSNYSPYYQSAPAISYPQTIQYTPPPVRLIPQAQPRGPTWATPTPAPPSSGPIAPRVASPEPAPAPVRDPVIAPPPENPTPPLRSVLPSAPMPQPSKPGVPLSPSPGDPAPPPEKPFSFPEVPTPPPENKVMPSAKPADAPKPEPPLLPPPPGPSVQESRSYYDAYPVIARDNAAAEGRCAVCFWNLSNRDVQVTAAGQTQMVARGKKWMVELPRTFHWQLRGQEVNPEQVGERQVGLEIVIRK